MMPVSPIHFGRLAAALLCVGISTAALAQPSGAAELAAAIRVSDYDKVTELLRVHVINPNSLMPDGSTPLSWAVESQDPQMVKLLLRAEASPDAADNAAVAPLMLACEHGNSEIVNLLLDAGAKATIMRDDGITPLTTCAGTVPAADVARLIDLGAVVDAAEASGQTPLMWAAAKGRIDNAKLLLAKGANVNSETKDGFTPLFFALKSGNPELPQLILEAGGNPDHVGPLGTTVTQLAIFQGDYAFAKQMIERGVDVTLEDANGHTLLLAALSANQSGLVKLLLEKGSDPNRWSGTSKIKWGYEPNFKNIEYDQPSKAPLIVAAEKGAAEMIDLLVEAGADPNVEMPDGTTIIHAAIASDRVNAVAAALRARPEVNVQNENGDTPLHAILALRRYPGSEAEQILKLLAAQGARTDIMNKKGKVAVDMTEEGRGTDLKPVFLAVFGQQMTAR
ncbi:MAG: ankyrin repeat domain-containing protein [Pseudomonadota bacterium]